jgi:hypothetical protein
MPSLSGVKFDGFVKSPSAALRCILRRCGVPVSTPHSSGLARLASGAFYIAIQIMTFHESIKFNRTQICADKHRYLFFKEFYHSKEGSQGFIHKP